MKRFFFLIILIILGFSLMIYTADVVFEKIPHSQDEVAYLFQAKIFKSGHLYINSLASPLNRFFDHEFVVNNGKWYGKYSPGASFFLMIGMILHLPWVINPFFGAASLFLIYLIVKKMSSHKIALLTCIFYICSPFYILIASTYMSHAATLFFTLLFLFFLIKQWGSACGIATGIIFLLRPFNIIPIIIIYIIATVFLYRKKVLTLLKHYIGFGIALIGFLIFQGIYNQILTGSPFQFPFREYSQYDFIGFGLRGVEWGSDFTLSHAIQNLSMNLLSLRDMLFLWPNIIFGIFACIGLLLHRTRLKLLLFILFIAQILAYFFYFHPGTFLGPRYWYEVSWIIFFLTAEGIYICGSIIFKFTGQKYSSVYSFIAYSLMGILLISSMPVLIAKLDSYKGYNGMSPVSLSKTIKKPAIVFINGQNSWQEYGRYFILLDPILNQNDIIFARNQGIHNVPKNLQPVNNELLIQYLRRTNIYYVK